MGKRLVILGAGESGTGAALLAKHYGYDVFVSDSNSIKEKYKIELTANDIDFEENQHTDDLILNADEIIKSPGIAEKAEVIKKIRKENINVISEIEFAGRYTTAKKICITGSNGKTTTTSLIYYILKNAGLNVGLAGNIGQSFARMVLHGTYDYYVIELSSFQLDDMFNFKAELAILLNITPDHLDRYNYEFQNYINSKLKITQNLTQSDFFIYCYDDSVILNELESRKVNACHLPFSLSVKDGMAAYITNDNFIINFNNETLTMTIKELALKGRHNLYNSMAAAIAAKVVDIKNERIRESLQSFQGVEHRLEHFLRIRGVEFVNDSKATNVNSTWYALECMTDKVVWIAGGVDKGNDYSALFDLAKDKVKALVCLGKDNQKLNESFKEIIPVIVNTDSMEEAVRKAYQLAAKNDVVLLSPCCASFDLFENYEHRGRMFKDCVRNL
jgi:UDP-N-acetylmuramoylalanine--D-glutamate ligase